MDNFATFVTMLWSDGWMEHAAESDRLADNPLATVQLRFLPSAVPLRTRAIAQIALKNLFTYGDGVEVAKDQVLADLREVLHAPHIPETLLDEALVLMERAGQVALVDDRIRLAEVCRSDIERDASAQRDRIERTLTDRFPLAIPRATLDAWFRETCVSYFGLYGSQTAASVLRRPTVFAVPVLLDDLIERTARRHGLADFARELTQGFRAFIETPTLLERATIWSAWQAVFAARLIASEIGADPITVAELRDSLVLIDTNVLFSAMLEAHEHNAPFVRLAGAFGELGLRMAVLPQTVDELERFVHRRRDQVLAVWQRYRPAAIARVSDPFVKTGLQRRCTDREAWERFFDSIRTVPDSLNGTRLEVLRDERIRLLAEAGASDPEITSQVAECFLAQRRRNKLDAAVAHDAAIVSVIEAERRDGRRAWVLTADRTMSWLSAERAGTNGLPTWITADTVLEIMASAGAAATFAAEDFGGILAAILRSDLQPVIDTYTIEDLEWLLEIEARAADLDVEGVATVAKAVARARLRGLERDDPELHLVVNRAFQRERMQLTTERDEVVVALDSQRRDLEAIVRERDALRTELGAARRTDRIRHARLVFMYRSFGVIGVTFAAAIGILLLAEPPPDSLRNGIGGILAALGFTSGPALMWRNAARLIGEVQITRRT